jgi:gamma-glutamyltranspeptidase / glutathione hydrolase
LGARLTFTTRPELRGSFGAVASTHWLATQSGMAVLERGGNAFDAACAAGFVLQVVEPHMNGPGGDLPAVFWSVDRGEPLVLCAQGVSPAAATIGRYRELGHGLVPGTGLLAACVPGSFGGWLLLLEELGTWPLADVLAFAIHYAEHGYPIGVGAVGTIARVEPLLREWPGSAELYLPVPQAGATFRNAQLAATWRRLLDESGGTVEGARRVYYEGFVAEEIDRFSRVNGGLLTGDDVARWRATFEPPATVDYRGLTVCKTGAWGQGPAGLQQLAILDGLDVAELSEAELVHVMTEAAKLAFADRDANYGDVEVPLRHLLSKEYAAERRNLIAETASEQLNPGLGRLPHLRDDSVPLLGGGEPTRGDTVHLDVADRFGNLISATPSGGWLQSSPTIPALGWPLGSRAQMFWLEEGLPSSLAPGKRPRTTLSPGLVLREGEP